MTKLLIADDEAIIAMQLSDYLTSAGYDVIGTVSSGEESLRAARKLSPDLILMDIIMPGGMDGIEAARKINRELDIPVIFLTSFADEKLVERAKSAGPYGYLLKPFTNKEIFASIEVALYRRRIEREIFRATMDETFDPLLVFSPEGELLEMNKQAETHLGYAKKDLIGISLRDLFTPETVEQADEAFRKTIALGGGRVQGFIATRTGSEIWVNVLFSLLHYGEKKIVLGTIRDERARRRAGPADKSADAFSSRPILICAACRKLCDDDGRWVRMEEYFKNHGDILFSHGLCPQCAHKLWPDMPPELYKDRPLP